jgi:nucleoid-associated protein YgaU
MRNFIILSFISISSTLFAQAMAEEPVRLQDNPPDRYIVVKGDTLWAISQRFLKDPWQWPQVWGMNREQIKNPHLIYPGDVIVLDLSHGVPTLRLLKGEQVGGGVIGGRETVKLSPQVRAEPRGRAPIPTIPAAAIEPFLSQPLVVEAGALDSAPRIVAAEDAHVVLGAGDRAYVYRLTKNQGVDWQIYRPGKTFIDPETREILGYEAVYLGDAKVVRFEDGLDMASPIDITKSSEEISTGDRLAMTDKTTIENFVPHAPEKFIRARIISAYGGISEVGQDAIVTLNKGARDGIERGHVLAIYRRSPSVKNKRGETIVRIPDERYGLMMVFRTFNKVSYALVMQITRPVHVLDVAQTP